MQDCPVLEALRRHLWAKEILVMREKDMANWWTCGAHHHHHHHHYHHHFEFFLNFMRWCSPKLKTGRSYLHASYQMAALE
jgi:hypothetical protein